MSSMIPAPAVAGNQPQRPTRCGVNLNASVNRLLATAVEDLNAASDAGKGWYAIHVVDFLARLARRQHGTNQIAARRVLAVALGRVGNPHAPTTANALAARIRIAQRTAAGDTVNGEALRRVRTGAVR